MRWIRNRLQVDVLVWITSHRRDAWNRRQGLITLSLKQRINLWLWLNARSQGRRTVGSIRLWRRHGYRRGGDCGRTQWRHRRCWLKNSRRHCQCRRRTQQWISGLEANRYRRSAVRNRHRRIDRSITGYRHSSLLPLVSRTRLKCRLHGGSRRVHGGNWPVIGYRRRNPLRLVSGAWDIADNNPLQIKGSCDGISTTVALWQQARRHRRFRRLPRQPVPKTASFRTAGR